MCHKMGNFLMAVMIAFHTDLVPQLVYFFENDTLEGFVNTTQSFFEAEVIRQQMKVYERSSKLTDNITYCM